MTELVKLRAPIVQKTNFRVVVFGGRNLHWIAAELTFGKDVM